MRIVLLLSVLVIMMIRNVSFAQDPDKKILMSVAGREVEAGEFIRMFKKNMDPANKTDVSKFLGQFVDFKLKVADAMSKGYDTTVAFRNELNGYRTQLAQNYLTDTGIKEELLAKAYERSLIEIKASHILIGCPSGANPEDTLKAYNKAMETRERILKGEETFEQAARSLSDDRSVQLNGGNLGYFTVFQMIKPFEDAAFDLEPGSVSMPVRTSFGYHLIQVTDKRPSRGKIRVAHIMKAAPPGSPDSVIQKAKNEIDDIYSQLQNNGSFRDLAAKYSDHRETASNGGEMNMFGTGEIIPDFSEPAFAIRDTGDFTEPVRTSYGFHIIKLLERKAPPTFEEARPYLESKLNQLDISSLGRKSFTGRLKKEYNFNIDSASLNWFIVNTDTLITHGKSGYTRENLPAGDVYTFADQHLTNSGFADYLEKRSNTTFTEDPVRYVSSLLETCSEDDIIRYEDSILEQKYPDFRYLMNEFHDGILLFDISSEKVWNKVQEDSTGFKEFYKENLANYMTKKSIEAKIYTLRIKDGMKKLKTVYERYSAKTGCDERLYKKFSKKGDTLLVIRTGMWLAGDESELDKLEWVPGTQSFEEDGIPSIIVIKTVVEPVPLPYDEIKADVLTGYQDWLTEEWMAQLKSKYPVEIDSLVFDEVKKKLTNE